MPWFGGPGRWPISQTKNYVTADFTDKEVLKLTIDGVDYEVVQYANGSAINEIPTAVCLLAVGRNIQTNVRAAVHTNPAPRSMTRAQVYFAPKGELSLNSDWPEEPQLIFDGFVCGFSYDKINGKIQVTARLVHWLAALAFSSCCTATGHVASPAEYNAAAVNPSYLDATLPGMHVTSLAGAEAIAEGLETDLWGALKKLFCALANVKGMPVGPDAGCGGDDDITFNSFALEALSRIEGPQCPIEGASAEPTTPPYTYGAPLALTLAGSSALGDGISQALGDQIITSYAGTTFWDKLVGELCPLFHMAVVPMIDKALVVAYVPMFSGGPWKTLTTGTIEGFSQGTDLFRPLRAVGVISTESADTGFGSAPPSADFVGPPPPLTARIGGCWTETSVTPGDGLILYVDAPPWLTRLPYLPGYVGGTTGTTGQAPVPSATNPTVPAPDGPNSPGTFAADATTLYRNYAHAVFVSHALRGRTGTVSGKLRFDVAPGSIVKIESNAERFDPGDDELAITLVGCVQRVTVSINAETGTAGTTFQLSDLRTLAENSETRTSVDRHPLFGTDDDPTAVIHGSGKHGCPLIPAYDLPD